MLHRYRKKYVSLTVSSVVSINQHGHVCWVGSHLSYPQKINIFTFSIGTDCEGQEYTPAIFMNVNKMVAIVGDVWKQLTTDVAVIQLAFHIHIGTVVCVGLQMGDAGGWSWVLGPVGHTVRRFGFIINILEKLRGTGLRASFLRKRFGWRCLLVIVDQKDRDNLLTSSSVSFSSRSFVHR